LYIDTEFVDETEFRAKGYPTQIEVWEMDSIDAGFKLFTENYRPVVLNMANYKHPGGGYKNGAGAQEECLFRRSNYFEFLDGNESSNSKLYEWELYPMTEFGGIYSQNVLIFRANEAEGYRFLLEPYFMSFVAQAAYNIPKRDRDDQNSDRLDKKLEENTEKKIRSILKIALNHGHDSIVLGAFGCGAFNNPPQHIAEIFKKVLEEFHGCFNKVVFAILEDHNSAQNSKQGNLKIFRSFFRT